MVSALELLPLVGVIGLLLFLVGILWRMRNVAAPLEGRARDNTTGVSNDRVAAPTVRRRRGGLAQLRAAVEAQTDQSSVDDMQENSVAAHAGHVEEAETGGVEGRSSSVRMGRKKEASREAKRAAREAREEALAVQRERMEKAEEARAAEKEADAAAERAAEEAARSAAEERAKKEEEEYAEWKGLISVEDAGDEGEDLFEEDSGLLEKFISYVKENKIVVLEELAAEFGLKTEDGIQRLTALEENGTISGVFDDRGKFIYVTPQEMNAVAEYINRRGRVSISELATESTRLLHLDTAVSTS